MTLTGPSAFTVTLAEGFNLKVSLGSAPPAVFPATQCEAKTSHLTVDLDQQVRLQALNLSGRASPALWTLRVGGEYGRVADLHCLEPLNCACTCEHVRACEIECKWEFNRGRDTSAYLGDA